MKNPQTGIFALGTSSHAYLEFDAVDGRHGGDVVAAIASLREPRTTMGGVNLVAGFRPELWGSVVPDGLPPGLEGFNSELSGADGFTMPATQHDAVLWLSGAAYDVIFDAARAAIGELAGLATVAEETSSWSYQHDRDLTGFIDGTENPTLVEAPGFVLVPEGSPGEGGTVLLLQKWEHDAGAWDALPVQEQELAMGRTKLDSVELENKPADSHVATTDQDSFGHIFRRNMAYGTVTDHGTMFVGFASEQKPLADMLTSMVETPDALTRYTHPLTGAYYFVPSIESLLEVSGQGPSSKSSTVLRRRAGGIEPNSDRLRQFREQGGEMGFDQYHEPAGELSAETRTFARMIASLTEEAEAIGWYEQRISLEPDAQAKAIMENAQAEEFKHFGMDLEFLLRRTPKWRVALRTILFSEGDIVEAGEQAEEAEGLG
jgi:porphyrinogen peroxidase